MPTNIKAGLSVIAALVAMAFAYWEWTHGRVGLAWLTLGTGAFMLAAMGIFPEARARNKGGC